MDTSETPLRNVLTWGPSFVIPAHALIRSLFRTRNGSGPYVTPKP